MSDSLTLKEFDGLCAEALKLDQERKELETKIDIINETLTPLKSKIQKLMGALNLSSFRHSSGGLISTVKNFSVKFPNDLDKKESLKKFLQTKGIFDEFWTVNYQKLNSFYKAELEHAQSTGNLAFEVPGLTAELTEYIKLKGK